jgi:hypothetical protein
MRQLSWIWLLGKLQLNNTYRGKKPGDRKKYLKRCLDQKRLYNAIDELRTKLRDQAKESVNERRNLENAWTVKREALNEKSSTLESEIQLRQTIHDARLDNEQGDKKKRRQELPRKMID